MPEISKLSPFKMVCLVYVPFTEKSEGNTVNSGAGINLQLIPFNMGEKSEESLIKLIFTVRYGNIFASIVFKLILLSEPSYNNESWGIKEFLPYTCKIVELPLDN